MPSSWTQTFALCAFAAQLAAAVPLDQTPAPASAYAPQPATCPTTPLVRDASGGLSSGEAAFVAGRKPIADQALAAWLSKIDPGFDTTGKMPMLGLASSGGGYRAFLGGAGVVQGLDGRDTSLPTGGLLQAMTYHVGLSGGAWLAVALAANGWQTISSQMSALWSATLSTGVVDTALGPINHRIVRYTQELWAKKKAGFPIQIADPWGAILSDMLVYDNATTYSAVANSSDFAAFNVPFPIVTATGVNAHQGECYPNPDELQYEISPYDFGSWDAGLHSFAQTEYLGSNVTGGAAAASGCVTGYDNVGYVLGTISNLFNGGCYQAPQLQAPQFIKDLLKQVEGHFSLDMVFAQYPNPFFHSAVAQTNANVSSVTDLTLADGGETHQNNPLWPFLQPERAVDVVFVNDNGGNATANYPNGTEMYTTYMRAQQVGLDKMPPFPDPDTFQPSVRRPWFFGCHNASQLTLIYLPNTNYTLQSNFSTYKLQYDQQTSAGMIANGAAVASLNGDPEWPTCLGCGIMQKTGAKLPDACSACLQKYCYN